MDVILTSLFLLIVSKHFLVLQTLMTHFLRTLRSIGKRTRQKLLKQVMFLASLYQLLHLFFFGKSLTQDWCLQSILHVFFFWIFTAAKEWTRLYASGAWLCGGTCLQMTVMCYMLLTVNLNQNFKIWCLNKLYPWYFSKLPVTALLNWRVIWKHRLWTCMISNTIHLPLSPSLSLYFCMLN